MTCALWKLRVKIRMWQWRSALDIPVMLMAFSQGIWKPQLPTLSVLARILANHGISQQAVW